MQYHGHKQSHVPAIVMLGGPVTMPYWLPRFACRSYLALLLLCLLTICFTAGLATLYIVQHL